METSNDRREFIRAAAVILGAATAAQLLGCGTEVNNFGNGFGSNADGTAGPGDKTGFVSNDHPIPNRHSAIIKRSELANGQLMILSIQGNADHDHTISLTAQDLSDISHGTHVSKVSSFTNGHDHTITYN